MVCWWAIMWMGSSVSEMHLKKTPGNCKSGFGCCEEIQTGLISDILRGQSLKETCLYWNSKAAIGEYLTMLLAWLSLAPVLTGSLTCSANLLLVGDSDSNGAVRFTLYHSTRISKWRVQLWQSKYFISTAFEHGKQEILPLAVSQKCVVVSWPEAKNVSWNLIGWCSFCFLCLYVFVFSSSPSGVPMIHILPPLSLNLWLLYCTLLLTFGR